MTNTVTQVKRLLGRKFSEAGVQEEMKEHLNFNIVATKDDDIGIEVREGRVGVREGRVGEWVGREGRCGCWLAAALGGACCSTRRFRSPHHPAQPLPLQVTYNDATRVFSPTAILGAYFTKMKSIIQGANPGVTTPSVVVSVPSYFTDAQRQAVRDACAIAGLNCLRTLNDGTAAVLNYGVWKSAKKEFPEGVESRVLFLDMGAGHFSATVAGFTNESLRILSSVSDDGVGGREFDLAIARHFAGEFKAKTGLDAWASRKARVKLLVAAEKAKIAITPYGVNSTPVSVECLHSDRDFATVFTLETLEGLVAPLMVRVGAAIKRALAAAGNTGVKELLSVELVGGGMRPRPVKRVAAEVLSLPINEETGHGLSSSMNLDEAVARGCAFACAMLSPQFRVKAFDMQDIVPRSVRIAWDPPQGADAAPAAGNDMDVDEDAAGGSPSAGPAAGDAAMVIFRFGESVKSTGLVRRVTFRKSEAFTISAEYDAGVEAREAGLAVPLYEGHPRSLGRFLVSGFPAPEPGVNAAGSKVRVDFKHDIHGQFSVVRAEYLKEVVDAPPAEAPAAPEGAPPPAPKRLFKRIELTVAPVTAAPSGSALGLPTAELSEASRAESAMARSDAELHATQEVRNSLEAFIYRHRDDLGEEGALSRFLDGPTRERLQEALNDAEAWLYDHFEADRPTYEGKLKELQAAVRPVAARKAESEGRYEAIQALAKVTHDFRGVLDNTTGAHGHLSDSDRDTLRACLGEADAWVKASTAAQASREIYQDPAFTCAEVASWIERTRKECAHIAAKPVPAPVVAPAPQAPAPTQPPAEDKAADATMDAPPPAPAEGMQTE